jgi:uncharacterized protein YbjT (DUF2867 family)
LSIEVSEIALRKEIAMNVLVTGGTGHLGRPIVDRLRQDDHHVRVLARRPGDDVGVEWIRGDLGTGEGVVKAVAGAEIVVHAATNSPAAQRGRYRLGDFIRSPTDVDVDGTRALLEAAAEAGVEHFVHVSIVGLPQMKRVPYAKVKIAAEELVRGSRVPWSIVRATGFYWLLDRLLAGMTRRRVVLLPAGVSMQPVDSDDFADYVVETVTGGPRGEAQDFVGPETLTMQELVEQYLAARGLQRRIWRAPVPRGVKAALGAHKSSDARQGSTTWAEWLRRSDAGPGASLRAA